MSMVLETVARGTFTPTAPSEDHWACYARRVLASAAKRSMRERVSRLERELLRIAQAKDDVDREVVRLTRSNDFHNEREFAMRSERDVLERVVLAAFTRGGRS